MQRRAAFEINQNYTALNGYIAEKAPAVGAAQDAKMTAEARVKTVKLEVAQAEQELKTAQGKSSGNLSSENGLGAEDLRPDDELRQLELLTKAMFVSNRYGDAKNHRNRIQDRLLLASQQRCNFFKDYIRRVDAYKSFGLGSLTTILGGASAIVTGEAAARILGGSAGIVSGVHAEFDQAFFQNLAIHVITPAIEIRRNKTLRTIRARQIRNIEQYSIQYALHDALRYHNECSINAGFEEAADSIKTVKDPGLRASTETVERITRLRRAVDAMNGIKRPDVFNLDEMPVSVLIQVKSERDKMLSEIADLTAQVKEQSATTAPNKLASVTSDVEAAKTKMNAALANPDEQAEKASAAAISAHEALKVSEAAEDDVILTQDFASKNFAAQELSAKYRRALGEFEKEIGAAKSQILNLLASARGELLTLANEKLTTPERIQAFVQDIGVEAEEGKEMEAITLLVSTAKRDKLRQINTFFVNLDTAASPGTAAADENQALIAAFDGQPDDPVAPLVEELQVILQFTKPDGDLGTPTRDRIKEFFPDGLTKDSLNDFITMRNAANLVSGATEAPYDTTTYESKLKVDDSGNEPPALKKLNDALQLAGANRISDFAATKGDDTLHKSIIELRQDTTRVNKVLVASGFVTEYLIENLK